jgi:CRP/FNR family cyclic AMP-dependent transcriptional regulator
MSNEALFAHLPELTEQLGAEHVQALVGRVETYSIEPGTVLIRDQAPMEAFYLVLEGTLALSIELDGHTIELGELRPGNWVGEVAYLSGSPMSCATVTATSEVKLARLSYADFEAMVAEDPIAACRLMHGFILMLIRRLRATANDPVLDPDGQLHIHGDPSVPWEALVQHRQSVLAFLKRLLGGADAA